MEQNQPLIEFNKLPPRIKDWVSSLQATYLIMEINKKLGLINSDRETIIPSLIFKLVTKSLDPSDFINELSHDLKISFENAKTVSEDIEKNVLHPIELDLRGDLDVDIKLFYLGKPKPRSADSVSQSVVKTSEFQAKNIAKEKEGQVVDLQSFRIKSEKPLSPLTFAPAMKEEKSTATAPIKKSETHDIPTTPFILHQESPTTPPSAQAISRPQEASSIKPSLTMKVQNFYQSSSAPERPIPKPVSIKVETSPSGFSAPKPEQPININRQDAPPAPKPDIPAATPSQTGPNQESRVVHYSNLRTPLTSLGTAKNVVEKDNILDLRKVL